jgi:beta-lactamase regulating signal transducer with metallopeptidase domain
MAWDPVWSPEWVILRYATSLRATLVLLLLGAVALLLHRSSASLRATLWAAVLLSLLPLPLVRAVSHLATAHVVPGVLAAPFVSAGSTMVAQSWPGAAGVPWTMAAGMIWIAGMALLTLRLGVGWLVLRRLRARSHAVTETAWTSLLRQAAHTLGVRRVVDVRWSDDVAAPLTWGTIRPVVLLPRSAAGWSEDQRCAVMLHELAHVRRLDCFWAILAHWSCITWWFHPGAWWAAHRLRLERERACDERVIAAGVRPSFYAECLMSLDEAARARRAAGGLAAGLLHGPHLPARLRTILRRGSAAVPAASRWAVPAVLALCAVVLLGVGSVRIGPEPAVVWRAMDAPAWNSRAWAAETVARFGGSADLHRLQQRLEVESDDRVTAMARFGTVLRERGGRLDPPFPWSLAGVAAASPY